MSNEGEIEESDGDEEEEESDKENDKEDAKDEEDQQDDIFYILRSYNAFFSVNISEHVYFVE